MKTTDMSKMRAAVMLLFLCAAANAAGGKATVSGRVAGSFLSTTSPENIADSLAVGTRFAWYEDAAGAEGATRSVGVDGSRQPVRSAVTDGSRPSGWYAGAEGGMPLGFSTFSSFGHDAFRPGFNAGIFGGYRFNPIFSAELRLKWGWTSMSARDCCAQSDYWLGSDGAQYYVPVLDIPSLHFSDIYSRTALQQYGAALNINLLGLFPQTRDSRWTLELTPQVYAASTRTSIYSIAGRAESADGDDAFYKTGTQWHFAGGVGLQAGYRITEQLRLAVYSAATGYSGSRIDAIPEKHHKSNMLWESGVRLSVDLGAIFGRGDNANRQSDTGKTGPGISGAAPDSGKPGSTTTAAPAASATTGTPAAPVRTKPEPCAPGGDVRTEQSETNIPCAPEAILRTESTSCARDTTGSTPASASTTTPDTPATTATRQRLLGSIYFATDEWTVPQGQYEALQAVLELINANPDAQIDIIGTCDHYGTDAMNMRISQLRADSVKAWLARRGVSKSRLNAEGHGVDRNEAARTKARRVSIYIMESR